MLLLTEHYRWEKPQTEALGYYLWRESRCDPHPPTSYYCGGPCYAAFQWDHHRWRRAMEWIRSAGFTDPWTMEAQVAYAVHEWLTNWPKASARFMQATTKHEALKIWDHFFGNGRDE